MKVNDMRLGGGKNRFYYVELDGLSEESCNKLNLLAASAQDYLHEIASFLGWDMDKTLSDNLLSVFDNAAQGHFGDAIFTLHRRGPLYAAYMKAEIRVPDLVVDAMQSPNEDTGEDYDSVCALRVVAGVNYLSYRHGIAMNVLDEVVSDIGNFVEIAKWLNSEVNRKQLSDMCDYITSKAA